MNINYNLSEQILKRGGGGGTEWHQLRKVPMGRAKECFEENKKKVMRSLCDENYSDSLEKNPGIQRLEKVPVAKTKSNVKWGI